MASSKSKKKAIEDEESGNSISIADIIGVCISNWYWFIICLCFTASCAYLYIRITPPVFVRHSSIVVKEDTNNDAAENVMNKIRGGMSGKSGTSKSLKNEIIAMKKPALMGRVVERLGLNYTYEIRGRLRTTVLHGPSLPITVESTAETAEFAVRIVNDNKVGIIVDHSLATEKIYYGEIDKEIKLPDFKVRVHRANAFRNRTKDDITVVKNTIESAAQFFLSNLTVANTDEESTVIDLSLEDVNIYRADDVLNTLVAIYNENWIENRNQVIVATNRFINERLSVIESELGDVENELTDYQMQNQTLNITGKGERYENRSVDFDNQSLNIEKEFYFIKYYQTFLSSITDHNVTLPLPTGIRNGELSQQINDYNKLILERSNLIASSTEKNPLVSDIDRQLDVLRKGISITIDNYIASLNAQVELLRMNQQKNLADIQATPHINKKYIDIERRRKIKDDLYNFLLRTREQNELNQAFAAYNTRVLQPSTGAKEQSFPDEKKIWLIALALGLGVPFVVLALREFLNTKVRGRRDIEKLTIPFVGEIPMIDFPDEKEDSAFVTFFKNIFSSSHRMKKYSQNAHHSRHGKSKKKSVNQPMHIVVKPGSRNVINEAYRVLRTNVEFIIGHSDNKVIMTTSANPHSGKTFISYNLAYCMSLKGKKVLAIDLDLRRRSLSAYVNKPEKGISDYINGYVDDWHDVVVPAGENGNFFVLPVGTLPPNPAEIISYDRFAELINEIRGEYDYVFFDCPPVEIVADTSILAKYADITLFVIRVGVMELDSLPIIEEYYNEHRFNNLGLILNGTLTANSRYGYRRYGYRYGYGYHYGYGYGYGYGDNESK